MISSNPPYTIVRYLFAVAVVATTFALGVWLIPMTGSGGPLALFFAALLVVNLVAGVGPGICAVLLGVPLATYTLVTRAGYPVSQAAFQALLDAIDGMGVVYLTFLMQKGRRAAHDSNRHLRDANDKITESMARTREVIELAPDAFFQADLTALLTDVNQAACRLLGYDRDELIGKTIIDIIPPEDVPRLAAAREYLLSPDTVHVAEWTLLKKDGTPIPVEVSAKILPDGRWQAFARDISERKRIERALQESEERFRLTIDEAPIGMALVALDGRFVRVNRALSEIVGYSSSELTELTFQGITHPDDLDSDRSAAGQLVRGEIPRYQRDKRYVSKNGTIVDVMVSASVIRDREGMALYFISQIEDIRERKRAERALQESEQRLNLALESGQVGMWDLDLLTDTSVRSLRHDQIFGYSSPVADVGSGDFHDARCARRSRRCKTRVRKSVRDRRLRHGMPNPVGGHVYSLDLRQGSRLSERDGRSGENDGHADGHHRAQAHRRRTQGCQRIARRHHRQHSTDAVHQGEHVVAVPAGESRR